jgi:flagellar motor switch protein FliN/FliY
MTFISGENEALVDRLLPALSAAAEAAARSLPPRGVMTAGNPQIVENPDNLLPGPGARAVVGSLGGALEGYAVILVSAALAEAIERGPFGEQQLDAVLEPTLQDALKELQDAAGGLVALRGAREVDGALAFADATPGRTMVLAVPIIDAAEHVATVGVMVEPLPERIAPEPTIDVDIEPVAQHEFRSFDDADRSRDPVHSLELLHNVEMSVTAELGRTRMTVRELLSLSPGSVVELDRAAGSPVDVLVNGTLVARGEVVVIDEEFGIRISEIVGMEPTSVIPQGRG